MAAGDVHVSAKFVANSAGATPAALWGSDTIKMGIITNAQTPGINDSDPRWGAGGVQNYSTAEVTPGGNYSAGGVTVTSPAVSLSGAVTSLTATSPISVAPNASNPTGAYWGVFYDSTDAGKHVFGFVDLGGPVSLVSGFQFNINNASSGTQTVFTGTAT